MIPKSLQQNKHPPRLAPKTLAQEPRIHTGYMCKSVAWHAGLVDALGEGLRTRGMRM